MMSGTRRFDARGSAGEGQAVDWLAIERSPEFQELVQTRRRVPRAG